VPHEAGGLTQLGGGGEVVERRFEQQPLRFARETDGRRRCMEERTRKWRMNGLADVEQGKSKCKGKTGFCGNMTADNWFIAQDRILVKM
jgi:hypothetical protein